MKTGYTTWLDIPERAVFTLGGPTEYLKTGPATFRELCSYNRYQRVWPDKDLHKLVYFKRMYRE
jgi:hypothetical protein